MKKLIACISAIFLFASAVVYANNNSAKKADCCDKVNSCCHAGSPCCNK